MQILLLLGVHGVSQQHGAPGSAMTNKYPLSTAEKAAQRCRGSIPHLWGAGALCGATAHEPGEPAQTYSPCLGVVTLALNPVMQSPARHRAALSYAGAAYASCLQCPFLENHPHAAVMEPHSSRLGNQHAKQTPVLLVQLPELKAGKPTLHSIMGTVSLHKKKNITCVYSILLTMQDCMAVSKDATD